MSGIKGCYSCQVDSFVARDEDAGLGDIMVCDREYRIIPVEGWEFSDEVNSNSLEWKVACGHDGE